MQVIKSRKVQKPHPKNIALENRELSYYLQLSVEWKHLSHLEQIQMGLFIITHIFSNIFISITICYCFPIECIYVVHTSFQAPNANAYVERWA
jgi:hypothetical protein